MLQGLPSQTMVAPGSVSVVGRAIFRRQCLSEEHRGPGMRGLLVTCEKPFTNGSRESIDLQRQCVWGAALALWARAGSSHAQPNWPQKAPHRLGRGTDCVHRSEA